MSVIPQSLGKIVIVVLVVDEKSGCYRTVVRVDVFAGEQSTVKINVVVVDSVFKSDQNHLRHFIGWKFSRNFSS